MAQGDSVIKAALTHGLTWAAAATVVALEAGFIAWFQPSLAMTAAALGLGVALLALWLPLLVRSEAFAKGMMRLPEEFEAEQREKLKILTSDFEELAFEQGGAQLRLLKEKIDNLAEVLKRRLNAGELTYGRYLGMAEQVYLSALDNLHESAVALRSISTIDPDYIEGRLDELRSNRSPTSDQEREFTALQSRSALFAKQRQRVDGLIAQNEAALTVLDKTASALAETKMSKGHADMDAESAMAELEPALSKRNRPIPQLTTLNSPSPRPELQARE
jgi:hypothetical protein